MRKLFASLLVMSLILNVPLTSYANTPGNNVDAYPFNSAEKSERFQLLLQEIRCVVCQNQNIADSNAPLAIDLQKKIYRMVTENKSNIEIKNYLVNRYGEFILLKPRVTPYTFILWIFPLIGIALIFLALFYKYYLQKNN